MKTLTKLVISIIVLTFPPIIMGGDVTIPNTFTGGTKAIASEVNANFTAVETEVNDNAADISTNTENININAADISANTDDLNNNISEISALRAEFIEYVCPARYGVYFNNRCYYLDGSGGTCDAGFQLAPQSILSSIAANFLGRTYKNTVSDNCCIEHTNTDTEGQDWGFTYPGVCNEPGPFPEAPYLNGANCIDSNNHTATQLTLCMSSE